MEANKQEHFSKLLLRQLREHAQHVRDDQAAALEFSDNGVMDSTDLSVVDLNSELLLKLGERESQLVADIDQALLRIKEGTFGKCVRCGKDIDERRLEALPTARYDTNCQTIIEAARGDVETPSL